MYPLAQGILLGFQPYKYREITNLSTTQEQTWRRGVLMVSALVSGAIGAGSSPGRGYCIVGKTLNSHSASLHSSV